MTSRSKIARFVRHSIVVCLTWPGIALAQSSADTSSKADSSPVVARVEGKEIHLNEIDSRIGSEAYELEKKLFTLRKQAINDIVTSTLLSREAARLGETVDQLLHSVASSVPTPDPAEVDRQFAENQPGLSNFGEAVGRYRILLELEATERTEAVGRFVADLRAKAGVETLIQEPRRELHLAATKAHLGSDSAAVQLVVFIDYDCPFCKKLEPTLLSMIQSGSMSQHLDIVVKQLPLPIHKTAHQAALAATCAADQHKFEAFHAKLLATSDHSETALLHLGNEAGLDVALLSKCMISEEAERQVEVDLADAKNLGIEATPSLFLDGTKLEYSDSDDLVRQVATSVEQHSKGDMGKNAGGGQ